MKAGSLIINLVETKTGQVVWYGLASGLTNTNGFDRDQNKIKQAINYKIKQAINLIFEKYSSRADAY